MARYYHRPVDSSGGDPRTDYDFSDDFLTGAIVPQAGGYGQLGWNRIDTGTGTFDFGGSVANHPGVLALGTSGVANDSNTMFMGHANNSPVFDSTMVTDYEWIIMLPSVVSVTLLLGFMEATSDFTNGGTGGAFFRFSPSTSAKWQCILRNASTSTTTTTTIADVAASTWYRLIASRASGDWIFSIGIDGAAPTVVAQPVNTNEPTGVINYGASIRTDAAATKDVRLDYTRLRGSVTR